MDVLTAAWTAAGRPQPGLDSQDDRCARCGQAGPVVALRAVISRIFTAYDGWTDPTGTGPAWSKYPAATGPARPATTAKTLPSA